MEFEETPTDCIIPFCESPSTPILICENNHFICQECLLSWYKRFADDPVESHFICPKCKSYSLYDYYSLFNTLFMHHEDYKRLHQSKPKIKICEHKEIGWEEFYFKGKLFIIQSSRITPNPEILRFCDDSTCVTAHDTFLTFSKIQYLNFSNFSTV